MHVYKNDPTKPKPHESMEFTQKAGVNIRYKVMAAKPIA